MNKLLIFVNALLVSAIPYEPATSSSAANASPSSAATSSPSSGVGGASSAGPGMTTDLSLPADKKTGKATFYTFWNSPAVSCNPMKCPDDGFCAAIPLVYMKDKPSAAGGGQVTKESCGKCVKVVYEKKAAIVRVMDTCPECPDVNIDLTDKLFEQLIGDKGKGRVQVDWAFVDCNSGAAASGSSASNTTSSASSSSAASIASSTTSASGTLAVSFGSTCMGVPASSTTYTVATSSISPSISTSVISSTVALTITSTLTNSPTSSSSSSSSSESQPSSTMAIPTTSQLHHNATFNLKAKNLTINIEVDGRKQK